MDLPDSETISAAALFVAALLAGLWGYLKKPSVPPATAAGTVMTAAIGMGWMEREQGERLLQYAEKLARSQERMAEALEAISDKKAGEMKDAIEELMEVMREKERRIRDLEGMRAPRRR